MARHSASSPTQVPADAGYWRRVLIIALGVLAFFTYVGLNVIGLTYAHDRDIEFAQRSQENLANVLEGHARSTVEKVDTVLRASQLRLNGALHGEPLTVPAVNATLAHYLDLIGESQSLRIADRDGRFIFDASGELASASISDRAYFLRNRADSSGKLVISEPLFARITKNWVITLSRRISGPAGEFNGLVQAAVRADHFEDFYARLDLGPSRTVSLIDDQLRLIARYPAAPGNLGKAIDSPALREQLQTGQRQGIYRTVSAVDGVERMFALRKVGDLPLYVLVGHAPSDYLANWRRQAVWSAISALMLAMVLTGGIIVWLRTYDEARRLAKGMTAAYETTVHRTRALLDSLPDPAWLTDSEQRMIAVNEACLRLSGRDMPQIIGQTVTDIWPESIAQALRAQDVKAISTRVQQRREATQEVAGGGLRHFEYISTPVLDDQGQIAGVAGVARDITQLHVDQERIRYLAEHDILTDLPNRALLGNRMAVALADALGTQAPLAVLFLDLDHFKFVNDTLGHEVGDQLLQQVSQRMRVNLDQRDTISRQGGDEFAVLMQGFKHLSRVAGVAQRLIDTIKVPFVVDGHELMVGVSIGISTYPQDGADISSLLKNADTAMYQAKAAGGNAYRFFTQEMNVRISERVVLENNLRRAILGQEFRLHYQPQVDGATGALIGLEALIRWHHPELGNIPPAHFIPVAEESSLINTIGGWVLREACRQSRAWIDQGYPPVVMAVNLSAVQLRQRDLPDQVLSALSDAGLDPQWLELEITESAFIRDADRIIDMLYQLNAIGIKLSVDDFGTGYSSLGYLKRLPFSRIKIDQSFVRELPGNEDDVAIIRAIVGIADSLKKEVIAEGVEQPAQRDFLLQNGCRLMQGYHFGRPMAAEQLASMMGAGKSFPGCS